MVESVAKHNVERLPFFLSVPRHDLDLFRSSMPTDVVEIFCEEDILACNSQQNIEQVYALRGGLQQQIIKSEFWRLNLCENYLVLDSDCVFIRDFGTADFLVDSTTPYSIVHEGRDLLQTTARFGPNRVREEFLQDRRPIMQALGRDAITYDFGYAPFLWSRRVWNDLAEQYLAPQGKVLMDAILQCQSEFTWYGESLLKFRSIAIWPREQLFRHYHYEHQYWLDQSLGITTDILAKDYLGVVYQSNWETWTEFGPSSKSVASRTARSFKRLAKKTAFKLGRLIS
jgi:hypothetical protein